MNQGQRRNIAVLTGAVVAGATSLAMLSVAFDESAAVSSQPRPVDPSVATCRVGITPGKQIVRAEIVDTKTGEPLLVRAFGASSVTPAIAGDLQHAIDPKTGDSHGFFHVTLNGIIPESCDVAGLRYQVK